MTQRMRRRAGCRARRMDAMGASGNEVNVGARLRALRNARSLSLRALAERSGLNFNTLSLIENSRTSPSVSTLQQIAAALQIPIMEFFQPEPTKRNVVFQKADDRASVAFENGNLEDLGGGLTLHGGQLMLLQLQPNAEGSHDSIVHTGQEFVFCLEGELAYQIDGLSYRLAPGDSLIFEAYLPHSWGNPGATRSQSLLILCPSDEQDRPAERHFPQEAVVRNEVVNGVGESQTPTSLTIPFSNTGERL